MVVAVVEAAGTVAMAVEHNGAPRKRPSGDADKKVSSRSQMAGSLSNA